MTTIWFTGLSGSGKTTIAEKLAEKIRAQGKKLVILDGDVVRKTISADLGYSKEERDKNITRIAHTCELITQNKVMNVACVISPTMKIREFARSIVGQDKFIEVYVKCPIEVCEERDVKGHYKKVRSGEIKEFVGITVPYEEPNNPDLILDTDKYDVEYCVNKIMDKLKERGFI